MLQAELIWIEDTLSRLKENRMQTYDIKKARQDLYAPKPGDFEIVDVPDMGSLMIDGHGDPNTSAAYHEVYLSDARKTEPAELKTILRQPVTAGT